MRMKIVMLAFAVCTFAASTLTSRPWCDELTFVDSAYNFLRTGEWSSNVWYCVYSPLFPLVTAGLMRIFGASHLVASASCILFALVSSCVLVDVMRRRRWIATGFSELAFAALFWCGWSTSWIWTDGRPDAATLLFSIILIDALAPDREGSRKILRTFLSAYFLVLTSSYMLPILFVFGCIVLVCSHGDARKAVFRRGFAAAGGIALGYATMVAFYWWQHELVRFVGFMAYFNSVTGWKGGSLVERLIRAYHACPEALVLVVVAAFTRRFVKELMFVALIPAVMVICGRYEPYYAWTIHVASVVLFVRAVPLLSRKCVALLLVLAVVLCFHRWYLISSAHTAMRAENQMAQEFVNKHRDLLSSRPVVVAADTVGDVSLYYPLLGLGADIWYRGPETLSAPSDREKFAVGLSSFVSDPELRGRLLRMAFSVQKCQEILPQNGLLVTHRPEDRDKVLEALPRLNRKAERIVDAGGYEVFEIEEDKLSHGQFPDAEEPALSRVVGRAIRSAVGCRGILK